MLLFQITTFKDISAISTVQSTFEKHGLNMDKFPNLQCFTILVFK